MVVPLTPKEEGALKERLQWIPITSFCAAIFLVPAGLFGLVRFLGIGVCSGPGIMLQAITPFISLGGALYAARQVEVLVFVRFPWLVRSLPAFICLLTAIVFLGYRSWAYLRSFGCLFDWWDPMGV